MSDRELDDLLGLGLNTSGKSEGSGQDIIKRSDLTDDEIKKLFSYKNRAIRAYRKMNFIRSGIVVSIGAGFLMMLFLSFSLGFITVLIGLLFYWLSKKAESEYDSIQEKRFMFIKEVESRIYGEKRA